jgi:predicted chitinase
MLISPPFLATRAANQTDDAWLDTCMTGGAVGDGAFPVSLNLGWHGGIHLDAPMNGAVAETVRAIADGTVVYVRQPTTKPADPVPDTNAQMYRGGWTDNGVVVIRHDTEIGEGANGKVSFFSITMHLRSIEPTVVINRAIYRKAAIGNAGRIYGTQNKIHFEIICDDGNIGRLMGRAAGDVALSADGRTDALYGEMYFHIPVGAQVFAQKPLPNNATAMMQPPTPQGQRTPPAPIALQTVHTTAEALIVGLRYAGGDGAVADRGDAYLTTHQIDGTALGAAVNENDAEYNLYTTATDISKSYPATGRPAPSAVYELLRFGRIIGPDALTPATVPHWRQVRYSATAQGWVNLNATNIHKFSDADLPQWKQWKIISDDTNTDSRCDSATIKAWLDISGDGRVDPIEATARLSDTAVANKLKQTICKFPTEWEIATIDARWGWLKTQSDENPTPLTEDDFTRLKAHITALCFWQAANLQTQAVPAQGTTPAIAATPIPANHWHWHPREFIRHFRKCGWLSPLELVQQLPANHPVGFNNMRDRLTLGYNSRTQTLPAGMQVALNKVSRKYLLETALRRAHFWGQIAQETDQLQTVREYASGAAYEGRADLGNTQPGDGVRFRGRGVIQLTGRVNYARYGTYRGMNFTADPNNLLIQNGAYAACDASTFYWVAEETRDKVNRTVNGVVKKKWILDGLVGISRRADTRTFGLLSEDAQITIDVSNVTKQVNRAQLHLDYRKRYFIYSYRLVSDSLETLQHANLRP